MLPGKGKGQMMKKSGKGGKVMPGGSKSKEVPLTKIKTEPPEDVRDPATLFPIIRINDNARLLPRYTAVLGRNENEGITMEDLDVLQLELEQLLCTSALRHRALKEEIALLEVAEERRDRKTKLPMSSKPSNVPPGNVLKRLHVKTDERPSKKLRDSIKNEGGKLHKFKGPSDSPKPLDVTAAKIVVHKNDTPNKFWASLEPYCAQITSDDIAYLEQLIRTREDEEHNDELMIIPPLGKHYTLKWSDEDLGEDVRRPTHLSGTTGPLTQRLVSALVEEKVAGVAAGAVPDELRELSAQRSAALRHVQSLSFERRVREELREQGILDGDEAPKDQADDELLLEIKRVQSERKALAQHNLQQLKHLHILALQQVERQEIKKKLLVIDTELMNIYASKQKKRQMTKKEKEQAWRYIKERETLQKQLYSGIE